MSAKNQHYNSLIDWLELEGVGWSADMAKSVGFDFVFALHRALFPLSSRSKTGVVSGVWEQLCKGPAPPDKRFAQFFGKKKLGQKADRPNVPKLLEYLSTALSGNGNWVQKGNWPSIIALLKALELSLFRYEERLGKQRDYDLKSKLMEEPLRSAETASHVETIEALKALAPNLLKGKYVRGVVTCKDCMRPRCMYSLTHPRNMDPATTMVDGKKVQPSVTEKAECKQYALQNFHAAAEHNSF
eukprot:jgi/Tetstr1/449688/TSEL_036756.t1